MKRYFIVSKKLVQTSQYLVRNGFSEIHELEIDFKSKLHLVVNKKLKLFYVANAKELIALDTLLKNQPTIITLKEIQQWEF